MVRRSRLNVTVVQHSTAPSLCPSSMASNLNPIHSFIVNVIDMPGTSDNARHGHSNLDELVFPILTFPHHHIFSIRVYL